MNTENTIVEILGFDGTEKNNGKTLEWVVTFVEEHEEAIEEIKELVNKVDNLKLTINERSDVAFIELIDLTDIEEDVIKLLGVTQHRSSDGFIIEWYVRKEYVGPSIMESLVKLTELDCRFTVRVNEETETVIARLEY